MTELLIGQMKIVRETPRSSEFTGGYQVKLGNDPVNSGAVYGLFDHDGTLQGWNYLFDKITLNECPPADQSTVVWENGKCRITDVKFYHRKERFSLEQAAKVPFDAAMGNADLPSDVSVLRPQRIVLEDERGVVATMEADSIGQAKRMMRKVLSGMLDVTEQNEGSELIFNPGFSIRIMKNGKTLHSATIIPR